MMHRSFVTLLLLLANGLIPTACLLFASGFFPYKPFIPGFASYSSLTASVRPTAPFDKIVFMLIDALRSDFVFSNHSGFHFTHSLIKSGAALPFTAYASPPTVTMPRIKALTTGSIPSFVDMILNIAESDTSSTLSTQDNWLFQMQRKPGGKAIMYGDDTWLKLFPTTFSRSDGTSSFFVADFTEVDNNVTRHIPNELDNEDWNVMILHYLGVDHIGHKSGPRSHHMIPKQKEMDGVVERIYKSIENKPHLESTVFVLVGDHGMNDAGNHGGSAAGETSAAMVFMSPKLRRINSGQSCPTVASNEFDFYQKVQQSDLSPTLAGLLGFPIPLNNLGVLIDAFLPMWISKDRYQLLLSNAHQMLDIVRAKYSHPVFQDSSIEVACKGSLNEEEELACSWKDAVSMTKDRETAVKNLDHQILALYKFCKLAQNILSNSASNYNVPRLWLGMISVATGFLLCLLCFLDKLLRRISLSGLYIGLTNLAYLVMMFASSFVEEEQQFWFWVTSAWISLQMMRRRATYWRPASWILILLRLARRWNQSGQKHQGSSDIAKVLQMQGSHGLLSLWVLVALTHFASARLLYKSSFKKSGLSSTSAGLAAGMTVTISILFKIVFAAFESPELLGSSLQAVQFLSQRCPSLVTLARLEFILLAGAIALLLFTSHPETGCDDASLGRLYPVILQLLILQTRITSIPLLLIFHMIIDTVPSLRLHGGALGFTSIAIAKCSYFSFGGTNAISSLDLSLAYNGVSSYNPVAVGVLLVIANFGIAMLSSATILSSSQNSHYSNVAVKEKTTDSIQGSELEAKMQTPKHAKVAARAVHPRASPMTLWISFETLAVMAGCTWLREHLFVWTVFSPRFLYQAAWVLAWHLSGNLGLAYALKSLH